MPCDQYCKGCKNSYSCEDCAKRNIFNRYDYLYDKTCGDCQDGTKAPANDFNCQGCSNKCSSCSNDGRTCNRCKDSSLKIFEDKATCGVCNSPGWYVDNQYCRRCDYSCLTCNGQKQNQCITCRSDLMKYPDGTCIYNPNSMCNQGFFKKDMQCIQCNEKCEICTSLEVCTKCKYSSDYLNTSTFLCGQCNTNQGEFIDQKLCSPCLSQCDTCSNSNLCSVCKAPYILSQDQTTCTMCDPNLGYFKDGGFCKKCDASCKTCEGQSIKCTSCQNGQFLSDDDKCVSCTNDGQYKDTNKCHQCTAGLSCLKCTNGNACTACLPNKYIYIDKGDCNDCQVSYFVQGIYCKKCDKNCLVCTAIDKCTRCEDGYFISNGKCQPCDPILNCKTCLKLNACQGCNANKYLYQVGKCDDCVDGYYIDANNCNQCSQNCLLCSKSTSCTKCQDGFFVSSKGDCQKCTDGLKCKTCDNASACTFCLNNNPTLYIYPEGQCDTCIKGYFISENKCIKCASNCQDCTSLTTCTVCDDRYFLNNGICKQCTQNLNCKTCINDTSCQTCQANQFIYPEGNCADCVEGYFTDNKDCKLCANNCQKCTSLAICNQCKSTYSFDVDKKCIQCPTEGYFVQNPQSQNICTKCKDTFNCQTCQNADKCSTCLQTSSNKYLYPVLGNCGQCLEQEGYYISQSTQCLVCPDSLNCQTCRNNTSCTSCKPTYYFSEDSNQCVKCNQDGQYIDGSNCKKCNSNCRTCTKESCSSCISNKYLYDNGQCDDCFDNYFTQDTRCKKCQNNCQTCQSESICKTCLSPYFLYADKSCKDCVGGYYVNDQPLIKECLLCTSGLNCKTCSNSTTCNKCKDTYFLDKTNVCVKCDQNGVYKKDELCLECKSTLNCATCNNQNQCQTCPPDNQLYKEGNCSPCKINEGYFIDETRCTQCNPAGFCQTCQNINECLTCKPSQYLNVESKLCENCTTQGFYVDTLNCKRCDPTLRCKQCNLSGSKVQCIDCPDGLFIDKDKKCQECTSEGVYKDNASKQCIECTPSQSCKTCVNGTGCATCMSGKYLNDLNACDYCLDGHYVIDDRCKKCNALLNCSTCKNNTTCETCEDNKFYLDDNKVCVLCDQSGQYIDGKSCKKCNSTLNCFTCLTGDKCETCNGSDKIQSTFICAPCGIGFYEEGKFCKKCNDSLNCKTCLDNISCEECKDGDFLKTDKSCGSCEEGYYPNGRVCQQCYMNCKSCKGLGQNDCLSCKNLNENLFTEGNCGVCPVENEYAIVGLSCVKCATNCLKCTGSSSSDCTVCKQDYTFVNANKVCDKCLKANSKYVDTNNYCQDCFTSCQECKDGSELCEKCISNKYFDQDNKCNTCAVSEGYFIDGLNCTKCDSTCKTCTGSTIYDCKECQGERKFLTTGSQKQCIICDTENKFFISDKSCLPCDTSCKKCRGATKNDCDVCSAPLAFNKSMICEPCTAEGWFNNESITKCIECATNCKKCTGATTLDCIECKDNYHFYNQNTEKNQCFDCPENSYYKYLADGKRYCGKCHFSCQTCKGPGDKDCTLCIDPKKFMPDGTCDTCPELEYYTDGTQCKRCDNSCSKCKGSTPQDCTLCKKDLYFHIDRAANKKVCLLCDQTINYYIDNLNCEKCDDSCKTCSKDINCTSCEKPLALFDNNSCKTCQQDQQYYLTSDNKCKKCDPSCQTCSAGSNKDCKQCFGSLKYFAETKTCETCPAEFYFQIGNDCKKCNPLCKTCQDDTNLKCGLCSDGNYKMKTDGSCIQTCPVDNYYISNTDCFPCDQTCQTCSGGNSDQCKTCKNSLQYQEKSKLCVDCSMIKDHYIDGLLCKPCHETCTSCVGPNPEDCVTCKQDLYFKQQTTNSNGISHGKCETCGTFFFINGQFCTQCDGSCMTCKGKENSDCIDCNQNLYKENGLCITCDLTNSKYILKDECKTCFSSCKTCKNGSDNDCTSCQDTFYTKEGEDVGKCLSCPVSDNFYVDKKECKKCNPSCKTCSDNTTKDCLTCENNFYRKQDDETLCQTCPINKQYFIDGLKCLKCHESCQTCNQSTENNCTTCDQNYLFNSDKSKCIKCDTSNGYFISGDQCLQCDITCKTCQGTTQNDCLICASKKYKNQDDNYIKCQDCPAEKYFIHEDNQKCSKCDPTCSTCNNKEITGCTKCANSLYFHPDKTCKQCRETNFYKESDQCKPCNPTCLTCSGSTIQNCITCQKDLYFKEDGLQQACVECPSNDFFKVEVEQKCNKCHPSCLTCSGKESTSCNICKGDGHFKINGECGSCETNQYVDVKDNKCKPCHTSCKTCTGPDSNQCKECIDNTFFDAQNNCTHCDDQNGYFKQNGYCKKCHETCKTCKSESLLDCIVCVDNRYKKQDDGYMKCDLCDTSNRYFIEANSQRCSKCHESCKTCTDSQELSCSTCEVGLKRWANKQCKICPKNKYFVDGDDCKECHSTCLECSASGDDKCTVCYNNLSFYNKKCISCNTSNGQYKDNNNNCWDCDKTCQTCNSTSSTSCIMCRGTLKKDDSNQCSICDVDNGFFIEGDYCKKCHQTCKKCSNNAEKNNCVECDSTNNDLLYQDNTCQPCNPQNGFYILENANKNLRKCLPCHTDCKTCTAGDQNQCSVCADIHTFFDAKHYCKKCHKYCDTCTGAEQNQCIKCLQSDKYLSSDTNICSACKSNEFNNGIKCIPCSANCTKCKDLNTCLQCGNNTHLKPDHFCGDCQTNEYVNGTNECRPCHTDCMSCIGPQKLHCKQCADNTKRITQKNECGFCETNQFSDNIRCYNCDKDCSKCTGQTNLECTECIDSRAYLCNNKDINDFSSSYGLQKCEKSCIKCNENCATCFGAAINQCMTCSVGILQADFSCSKWCPKGKYFHDQNKKCEQCDPNCLECTNTLQCQVCEQDYTLYQGSCFKCQPHQFLDKRTSTCKDCHSTCKTCYGEEKYQCIDCIDDKAFIDQYNTCVYDCSQGYIKNVKERRCQECFYQRNPDFSLICVLGCEDNQFGDIQTRLCTNCINNCTKCTSLQHCTECQSGLSFASEKQEECKKCYSNQFVNTKNQCQKCPQINCLECNQISCTKCIHEYKIDSITSQCIYDTRYNSYECNGISKQDDSCENEIKFIDNSDLILKSSQYSAVSIQLISTFTVGTGSFVGYTLQMQQIIGNNMFYKEKIKTLSLGPTFYESNYQMNILSMLPNPFSYIPSYNRFINSNNENENLKPTIQNIQKLINTGTTNHTDLTNQLKDKRNLKNELTSNSLASIQSQDLSKQFLDTFLIYLVVMLFLGTLILICSRFNPNKGIFFDIIHEKKYSIIIQIQMIFSNFVYIAIIKSMKELDFSSLKALDYISLSLQFIYIVFYAFFAINIFMRIKKYNRKNEDLNEVKVYMSLIKNIFTDISYNKFFWYFFEVRKIFSLICIFFIPNPVVSCFFLLALNSFFVVFHLLKKPFFILIEQRYFYTLEVLNFINNLALALFLITGQKMFAWLTLFTLALINLIILFFTLFSLTKTLYIKFFQKRFIISTSNEYDIDYKWKQINQNNLNIKAIKFLKEKSQSLKSLKSVRCSSPLKSLERSTLNDSMNLSNPQQNNDYPVDLNELSIKWSMNPIYTRHIALQEFPRELQQHSEQ